MGSNRVVFDSPLEWCGHCSAWVAVDQTFVECARDHNCTIEQCPLAQFLKSDKEPQPELLGDPAFEPR
jgi:hypothetical protein